MTTKPPTKKKERFVPIAVPPQKSKKPGPGHKTPPPPPPKGKSAPPSGGGSATPGRRPSGPVAPPPTRNTSYTPDSSYAKQVVQQLKDLQSSMSQEDFAHLMQTNGLGSAPVGANGVLDKQQASGSGQMAFPGQAPPSGSGGSGSGGSSGYHTDPASGLEYSNDGSQVSGYGSGTYNGLPQGNSALNPGAPGYVAPGTPENQIPGYFQADASGAYMTGDYNAYKQYAQSRGQQPTLGPGATPTPINPSQVISPNAGSNNVPGAWGGLANLGASAAAQQAAGAAPGGGGYGGGSTGSAGTANVANLTGPQQNALGILEGLLSGAGLSGLVGQVQDLLSQGYTDPTAIEYLLEQTPEYERRFSGNAQREANGLAPLSPSEYLATERSYQDVLRASGMPSGFYDSPDDFASWIASDVSPSEVQNRVNDALHFAQTTDPASRSALAAYYGIDDAHIAAYFLDNQRALPLLNKQAATADIGGAALDQGLSLTDLNRALRFADLGVTQGQAQQAYGQIAGLLTPEQAIAKRFGTDYTQQTAEDELLGGDANAALKRSRLNMQEESLFAGASGTASGSLSTSASGSY